MDFAPPERPKRIEPVLPMVNLVFLLLIFFLLAAVIAPQPPAEIEAPNAIATTPLQASGLRLSVLANGTPVYGGAMGPEAITLIRADLAASPDQVLAIHADRRAPARDLAQLLADLDRSGLTEIRLVAEPAQ